MIGIVDYGMGNLNSIKRKFDRISIPSIISDKPDELGTCEKLILPGIGHFCNAMKEINQRGLQNYLDEEVLVHKKPILGICLGMQLMAKHSEEGDVDGFGWIDAEVIRFNVKDTLKFKVPHIGWNDIKIVKECNLFTNIDMSNGFYFVHSYHFKCNNQEDILNITDYEYPFVSAILKDNIIGVQYHPEKSHDAGEQLLKNFTKM